MKTIEKENGQIFEVCTSRAEFCSYLKDIMFYFAPKGVWTDEDCSLWVKYKNGREISLSLGDKLVPISCNQIASGLYNNPSTQMLYKLPIIFNEHYEDYEVQI
jgi:hypothetical protein